MSFMCQLFSHSFRFQSVKGLITLPANICRQWGDENVLQAIAFLFEMDIAMITMSSKPGIRQVFSKKRDNSKHSGDIDVPYLMIGNYSL